MKTLRHIFLLLFLFFISEASMAQSLNDLEIRYNNFSTQLNREYLTLDSLNRLFSQIAEQINTEKNKKEPDKDIIVKLMSSSSSLSNSIDWHREKINEIENNNGDLRNILSTRYNNIIDSLKSASGSGKTNSRDIESQILYYTEKKLIVEPGIWNLSYRPDKILNFSINNPGDKKEVNAYSEYLRSALIEVNSVIDGITEKTSGLKDVISLQKKTQKFLKEVEMESRPGSPQYSVKSSAVNTNGGSSLNDGPGVRNEAYYVQVHAYTLLMDQLSFDKSINTNIKLEYKFDKNKYIDLNKYYELLNEVKKNLVEYKTILKNKLDSFK